MIKVVAKMRTVYIGADGGEYASAEGAAASIRAAHMDLLLATQFRDDDPMDMSRATLVQFLLENSLRIRNIADEDMAISHSTES